MNTTGTSTLTRRDLRQRDLVPPDLLAGVHAIVVGVGAIGRQVAVQLAAIGLPSLELFDPDTVEDVNLAPQAYWPSDLGQPKVDATAALCRCIFPEIAITVHADRFARSTPKALAALHSPCVRTALFCCVDSIATRKLIWESVRPWASVFVDGRMAAEVVRVLASERPAGDLHYPTTLFAEHQAYGGACTARSTVYAASIAAGLMLSQFTKWLRGLPVDADLLLNLLSMELAIGQATAGR